MILLLSDVFFSKIGGSGRWLWEFHRRLNGHDIYVVVGAVAGAVEFDVSSELNIYRISFDFCDWGVSDPRAGFQYIRTFFRLNEFVARIRPDVIHCGKCLPEGFLVFLIQWRCGIPFSCFAHGEELTLADISQELRWLTRCVMAGARSIVVNMQYIRQILMKIFGASEDKVVVLHPGVDASRFKFALRDPLVRQRLGWTDWWVVLIVGTFLKRKGQDMMIWALSEIRYRSLDVLYVIVGEGPEQGYLEALVAEHHVSDLVQFRRIPNDDMELIECYQQCDLFVLPNRQVGWDIEGFGIVLIEVQACGIPVIAGLFGGTLETLELGRTGELISCDTLDVLVWVIPAFLEDRQCRDGLGWRARQSVLERFDWSVLARQAEVLFKGSTRERVKDLQEGD